MRPTRLIDRSWDTVRPGGLLVPVGATEQHGPHLPLDTDSVIASAVAHRVAERLADLEVLVAPTVAFGSSGEHEGFAGTVSIGTRVLREVLIELVRSVQDWAPWVVFVNGHGGNATATRSATEVLRSEGRAVQWAPCAVEGADAHAGWSETSIMLHLEPDRVDMARAEAGNLLPIAQLMPVLRVHGVRAVSASGVLGDPREATAATGEGLLAAMVTAAEDRVRSLSQDPRGLLVGTP